MAGFARLPLPPHLMPHILLCVCDAHTPPCAARTHRFTPHPLPHPTHCLPFAEHHPHCYRCYLPNIAVGLRFLLPCPIPLVSIGF